MKFYLFDLSLVMIFTLGLQAHATPTDSAGKIHFTEINKMKLGGEGGWDYLTAEPENQRLYLSRGQRVQVIDTSTGKTIYEVLGTEGVHGIALVPELELGFTSNGKAANLSAFELKTGKVVALIPVGQNPDAILYDRFTKKIYSFNGKSHDVSVVDPKEKKLVSTLNLSSKPEFAVSDGAGYIYVNLEEENALVKINAKDLKIEASYPLKPCEGPTGLSIDEKTHRLFAGCSNRLMAVINADNGKVIKTMNVGSQVDATAFDAKRNLIFVSAGEGVMSVIHEKTPNEYELVENVKTQKGARTLAFDSKTGNVFLASADFGPPPKQTNENAKARPSIVPNSFVVIVMSSSAK